MDQMVSRRDRIVTIGFDALEGVFVVETVLVLHDLENLFVVRHLFFAWEEPADAFLF
jgi:hypothetical protein